MVFLMDRCRAGASHAPFDQQLQVHIARGVPAKTMLERVIELFDAERVGAARVGPVQERAMLPSGGHNAIAPNEDRRHQ
jgi:hypothetical protein